MVVLGCCPTRQGLCYDAGTAGPLGTAVIQKISSNTLWRCFRCLKLNRHMEKGLVSHMAGRWMPNRVGQEVALGVKMLDVHLEILAFGWQKLGGRVGGGI